MFGKPKKPPAQTPLANPVLAAPDRHGLAMAAIVKDEVLDLEEWVVFHCLQGVRHIYIYDNGSTDGTIELVHALAKSWPVTLIPWVNFIPQPSPQRLAYIHALTNFGADYRWMMFIDVDEFAFPVAHETLDEAMKTLEHLPSIVMPWHMFGTSGHGERPRGLVIDNYTTRAPMPPPKDSAKLLSYKTIVDPSRVAEAGTHRFSLTELGKVMFNDEGTEFNWSTWHDPQYATASTLQLNHYFTKSRADFEMKHARGRVSQSGAVLPRTAIKRMEMIEQETQEDKGIQRFCEPVRAKLATKTAAPDGGHNNVTT